MRAILSCVLILLSPPASADSNIDKLGKIAQELDEGGLTPAHVTIGYSLTDDCGLTGLRVIENSHPEVLGSAVVDEVVRVLIGPYSGAAPSDKLIQFSTDGESSPKKLSTSTKTISWITNDGHRYLVCRFYSNGELESVRLTDGHGHQYDKKINDRIIDQALSEMEPKTMRASFRSKEE